MSLIHKSFWGGKRLPFENCSSNVFGSAEYFPKDIDKRLVVINNASSVLFALLDFLFE